MRRDPIGLLVESTHTHGEAVHFRMLNRNVVFLANPDHVRHVLLDNCQNYNKQTPGFQMLRSFLADGLLTNEGESWLRQRRVAQPAFHRGQIEIFAQTMTDATEALVDRWTSSGASEVDLTREMSALTLRIVGETLLSTDVTLKTDRIGQALTVVLRSAGVAINGAIPIPQWLPTPGHHRLRRAFTTLDDVVFDLIRARRHSATDPGDLLSMLMRATDEDTGEGMSDRQLRDEVMTIFLAGHETTAIALGWTWVLLSQHPAVARRLNEELTDVLHGRSPSVSDLPQLVYTE